VAASERFLKAFAVAEKPGRCATSGDASVILQTLDFYATAIARSLRPDTESSRSCAAARFDAAGATLADGLRCYARVARRDDFFDFDCTVAAVEHFFELLDRIQSRRRCTAVVTRDVGIAFNDLVGTAQRLRWTVCGDGTVEHGESCDGGPFCAECSLALPSCCQSAGFTTAIPICFDDGGCSPELGEQVVGGACVPDGTACPEPGGGCTPGTCRAVTTAPLRFCCEAEPACTETLVSDGRELFQAFAACPLDPNGGRGFAKLGMTCNRRGRCVPPSDWSAFDRRAAS
jgi:hypothetical protein